MNGTRIARMAALTAAVALGIALVASTLLPTGPPGGPHTEPPALTRTSLVTHTAGQDAAPRTTPPPTLPGQQSGAGRPAAATTVEHS